MSMREKLQQTIAEIVRGLMDASEKSAALPDFALERPKREAHAKRRGTSPSASWRPSPRGQKS